MYEDICYRKNTVKEVICRLDFANPVAIFDTRIPKEVYKTVKKYYPIAEPQEIIGTELQINPVTGPMVNNVVAKQWLFWSRDKKSSCVIQSGCVIFSIHAYDVFEELRKAVLEILKAVMKVDEAIQGKRLGLRYINTLEMGDHGNWITGQFFDALKGHKNSNTMRLITTLEYAVEEKDINVRLLYGYLNPDYPAAIRKETFTIDIDAYSQSIIFDDDLEKFIDDMHFEAQDCFEKMITDDLRAEMNKEG